MRKVSPHTRTLRSPFSKNLDTPIPFTLTPQANSCVEPASSPSHPTASRDTDKKLWGSSDARHANIR